MMESMYNFSNFENRTNFTYLQYADYVQRELDMQRFEYITMGVIGVISFIVSGFVGFASYFFMLATLRKLDLSECTLIYYKAMVAMELPHMVVMFEYGLLAITKYDNPRSWMWKVWTDQTYYGWLIADSFKLAVSTLTLFVSLERFIGVCFGTVFDKINQKWVAYAAVVSSLAIGSVQLWQIFTARIVYDESSGSYIRVGTPFYNSPLFTFSIHFVFSSKLCMSGVIFVLSVATAIRIWRQQQKVWAMSNDAKRDWKVKRRACALSYTLAGSVLVDHTVWVIHKGLLWDLVMLNFETIVTEGTYQQGLAFLAERRLAVITALAQALTGQLVHSGRFLIYLGLNQTMRNGIRKLFSSGNKVTTTSTR